MFRLFSLSRAVISAMLAVALLLSGLPAMAEGPNDPAPEIQPSGTPNGKKVLFDNTHGQTAGAADWVIDGAFSDFAQALADNGYYVKELRKASSITIDDLTDYDVFVIGEANIPYKTSEQDALLQFVQDGGSIFFISDHYNADRNKNRWDSSEAFNGYRRGAWADPAQGMSTEERNSDAMQDVDSSDWLADNFGVRFRYNAIGDVNATTIVPPSQAFNITSGVSSVAIHAGSTLAIVDPQIAKGIVYLPATNVKWPHAVDQGVYNGGGIGEGPYVAVAKVGLGKAGFIGDSSPVEDATPKYLREETGATKKTYDGFLEQDDATLLVNMVDWLAVQENYTSLSQVPGLQLDQPTPLLPMEDPVSSTEPVAEPWATPAPGYKWWDQSTFKPGSYGYTNGGGTPTAGLFFSEYIEGSGYNKAVEIYNGTGSPVNLSGYSISSSNLPSEYSLSGTLASGDVYVVANPSASGSITSQADALSPIISFNGDDAVTLKYNGTAMDVIGTAGSSFGANTTLVRKSAIAAGSTVYNAAEWDTHPQDTFSYLGNHTASQTAILSESFESGSKGAYAAGNVTLSTGSWHFDNALIGNLASDRKIGAQAVRLRAPGVISMNFNVPGAATVKVQHANFGSDSGANWKLQKSADNGANWVDVGGTYASSGSLAEQTISVNHNGNVRFRIVVSGTSGERINIDNFEIYN